MSDYLPDYVIEGVICFISFCLLCMSLYLIYRMFRLDKHKDFVVICTLLSIALAQLVSISYSIVNFKLLKRLDESKTDPMHYSEALLYVKTLFSLSSAMPVIMIFTLTCNLFKWCLFIIASRNQAYSMQTPVRVL